MQRFTVLHALSIIVGLVVAIAGLDPATVAPLLDLAGLTAYGPVVRHGIGFAVILATIVHYLWPQLYAAGASAWRSANPPTPPALMIAATLCVPVLMLAGCAGGPQPLKLVPPAQLAQAICPPVEVALKVLQTPLYAALLPAKDQATVSAAVVTTTAVCAGASKITSTDLVTLNDTVLPALVGIVAATPAIPDQPAVLLGLTLAGPLLQQLVDAVILLQAPPASSAPAASAPAGTNLTTSLQATPGICMRSYPSVAVIPCI